MVQIITENILGFQVVTCSCAQCIDTIVSWIENGKGPKYLVCANPHSLEVARNDPQFQKAICRADLVTPDGIGVVLASRILGGGIRKRVTGTDIFLEVSRALNRKGGQSCFFLGSTEENLSAIKTKLARDFPNIRLAGLYSPPFKPEFTEEDNRRMIDAVNRARPDVLWVGMTAPKQEKWIFQNRDRLEVKFIGAIGAVFDFYTGRVQRTHPILLDLGLEWLPRLLREPRRLWRRTLVTGPTFLLRVLQQRARLKSW